MLLQRAPIVRAGLTSCAMMAAGDLAMQRLQHAQQQQQQQQRRAGPPPASSSGSSTSTSGASSGGSEPGFRPDWQRAGRFAAVGLVVHGPFFYLGFRALDRAVGAAPTLRNALAKSALGQVTLFPAYLALFNLGMGRLEGRSVRQCLDKLTASFVPVFASGSLFWPVVNVVNFLRVPPAYRLPYINAAGLVWNAYLSWANSTYGAAAAPGASAAAAAAASPPPPGSAGVC